MSLDLQQGAHIQETDLAWVTVKIEQKQKSEFTSSKGSPLDQRAQGEPKALHDLQETRLVVGVPLITGSTA